MGGILLIIDRVSVSRMNEVYASRPAMRTAAIAMGKQPLTELIFDNAKANESSFINNHELSTIDLNTDMETIKKAVMATIDAGESVWFGSDVGRFSDRESGFLLCDITDYGPLFGGIDFKYSKEDKPDYRMSAMNHAMTITGYHEVNGKPVRWKIRNSWGDEKGKKGYYMMNDEWFDAFVYQAVVKKSLLPKEPVKALSKKKTVLNPRDPMGTLAD